MSRGRLLVALAASTVVVGAAIALREEPPDPCEESAARADSVDEYIEPLAGVLAVRDRPWAEHAAYGMGDVLSEYSARWRVKVLEHCPSVLAKTAMSECLDHRFDAMDILMDELLAGEFDDPDRALAAANALPSIEACVEPGKFNAAPAATKTAVALVRRDFITAQISAILGLNARAVEGAERAAEQADKLGFLPLQAEALELLGEVELETDEYKAGLAHLEAALHLHRGTEDNDRAHAVLIKLAAASGGAAWFDQARLAFSLSPQNEARLRLAEAARDAEAGLEDNVRHGLEQAIELLDENDPNATSERAYAHIELSHIAEDPNDALAHADEALQLFRERYGLRHPNVAKARVARGEALEALGRREDAVADYRKALGSIRAAYGDHHIEAAPALAALASARLDAGEFEAALRNFSEARRVLIAVHGEDEPAVAAMDTNIGNAHRQRGDCEAAVPLYERALAAKREQNGALRPTLEGLAACLEQTGDKKRAGELADEAEQLD